MLTAEPGTPVIEVSNIDRVLAVLAMSNLLAFGLFWFDKVQARAGGWRVPERLLLLSGLGGGLGAWMGHHILRHETRKEPFRTLLGLAVDCHLAGVAALCLFLLNVRQG
jgi:uncharacterized membrane protein YsdA (DUF1294 family)